MFRNVTRFSHFFAGTFQYFWVPGNFPRIVPGSFQVPRVTRNSGKFPKNFRGILARNDNSFPNNPKNVFRNSGGSAHLESFHTLREPRNVSSIPIVILGRKVVRYPDTFLGTLSGTQERSWKRCKNLRNLPGNVTRNTTTLLETFP